MEELRAEVRRLLKPRQIQLHSLRPTIAFDGGVWLSRLGTSDPVMRVLGGLPAALEASIRQFVNKVKEWGPKPIFVFDGLPFLQEPSEAAMVRKETKTKAIWIAQAHGHSDMSLPAGPAYSEDNIAEIFAILKSCGAECFRAPYKASMQLAYLSSNSFVSAVSGDLDLLVYDSKKILLEVDVESGTAQCVDSTSVSADLQLTREKLLQLMILKGYITGRELVREESKQLLSEFRIRNPITFLTSSDSLKLFELVENYAKSQIIIKPDKPETMPLHPQVKLETAIGLRFDHEAYFAMTVAPLSFQLLSAIASHCIVELAPVADSRKYRIALQKAVKIRENSYSLLISHLNEAFSKSEIHIQYWFGERAELGVRPQPRLKWVFARADVEQQITTQGRQVDFVFCLKWHMNAWKERSPLVENMRSEEAIEPMAEAHKDVLCRIFFKFLELSDFITSSGEPTIFGKVLLRHAGDYPCELFLILQMLSIGVLTGHTMSQNGIGYLDPTVFRQLTAETGEDRQSVLLISRVCSLIPAKLGIGMWKGPLKFPISQFYSITRLLHRNYRLLLEAIIISEFCHSGFSSPELFRGLGEKLPYRSVPNSATGLVLHGLLSGKSVSDVQAMYPLCEDIPGDLERCWKFWKEVLGAVGSLKKHGVLAEAAYENYVRADEIFARKMSEVREGAMKSS